MCFETMTGLDVRCHCKWEMLTPEDVPVIEPQNEDEIIKLPTEYNAPTKPKFAFKETFECIQFTLTYEK